MLPSRKFLRYGVPQTAFAFVPVAFSVTICFRVYPVKIQAAKRAICLNTLTLHVPLWTNQARHNQASDIMHIYIQVGSTWLPSPCPTSSCHF